MLNPPRVRHLEFETITDIAFHCYYYNDCYHFLLFVINLDYYFGFIMLALLFISGLDITDQSLTCFVCALHDRHELA